MEKYNNWLRHHPNNFPYSHMVRCAVCLGLSATETEKVDRVLFLLYSTNFQLSLNSFSLFRKDIF